MSRDNWRDQLDNGWSPQTRCGELEIVALLSAIGLVITGIAIAVLSCRDWKW